MIILHVDRIIRLMVESDRSSSSFMMNFCSKCYHVLLFLAIISFSFKWSESSEKKEMNIFLLCVKIWPMWLPVRVYVACNLTKMWMQLDCYAVVLLNLTKKWAKREKERNFRSLHYNIHSSLSTEYHLGLMNDMI